MCDNARECEAAKRQGFGSGSPRRETPGGTASVRGARPADAAAIRAVHESAFDTPAEADLVDELTAGGFAECSLVAVADAMVVGHVLLSRVEIGTAAGEATPALSLAPVAVRPAYQGRGIGSALVEAALECAVADGWGLVIVLGHPGYYPRFGFEPAGPRGIDPPWPDVPSEAWLLAELRPGAADGVAGTVSFPAPFDSV